MEIKHGFMEIVFTGEDPLECADELCTREIQPDAMCFVDVQEGGKLYCKSCGICERYHRKKATERKETI